MLAAQRTSNNQAFETPHGSAGSSSSAGRAETPAAAMRRERLLPLLLLGLVLGLLALVAVVGHWHHDQWLQQEAHDDEGVGGSKCGPQQLPLQLQGADAAAPTTATPARRHLLLHDSGSGTGTGRGSSVGGGGGGGGTLLQRRQHVRRLLGRRQLRQRGFPSAYGPIRDDAATGYNTPPPCDAQCVAICNSSPSLAVAYGFRCFATYSDNGGGGGGGGFGGGGSSGGGGGPSGGSGGSANKAAAHDG